MSQHPTIMHHFTVRGRPRTLCELTDVVAVRAQDSVQDSALRAGLYGRPVAAADIFPGAPAQEPDFQSNAEKMAKAGWHFIEVAKPQRTALVRAGYTAARVMLSPAGDAMLDAGGLTVRFKPALGAQDCAAALSAHGLTLVRPLGFASNLYMARAAQGESGVAAAAALARDERVEWAEPDLIEAWRHIPQRGLQVPRDLPGPGLG